MMDCDPGSAIFVACSCVFHRDCLEEWRGLKDKEKVAKADAATVSIKSQKDALDRLCAEAEEQAEEAEKQVAFHQLTVDRAATNVEQAMKKAQATADSDEEPSEAEEGEAEAEESDSSVELDSVDYRNEARWGAPEVSIGGMYHNKHTKKNWHPSVRMNRKRPKKYLKRIDEKLEELKKEGKRQLSEEMSQAVTKWEKALFEQKEAKLILDKEQENLKKLKEKSEKLAGELEWTANYLDEERQKFTSLPLLCPVCQNEVDVKEEKVQVVESEEKEPEVAPEEEEARKAAELRRAAAEEEERRQRAAAELAKVEEKMVRMLKGRPEDTDGDGDEPREENTEADLQGGYPTSPSQAVDAGGKAEPGETAEPEADAPRKEVDDELLTTIELLMEAYSASAWF
ncbi:unnamed protein product [Effrenium voratum]|uniref:Uncharacterized protein n=1 Tax=Effrenium voratum TaxID=2562239 RepID=A0AA36JE78_9DINO|nr:unnamed protein product [Effrenium voratum]